MAIFSVFLSRVAKELLTAVKTTDFAQVEALIPLLGRNSPEYCGRALLIGLDHLGTPPTGIELPRFFMEDNKIYERCVKCVDLILPMADCSALVRSPALYKIAHRHSHTSGPHYSHFFSALTRVVEYSATPAPKKLQDLLDTYDNQRRLETAAQLGNVDQVRALIPVARPAADSNRALELAAQYGHFECVRLLMDHSVFTNEIAFAVPLERAAQYGHLECVTALMERTPTSGLWPACLAAARAAFLPMMEALLARVELYEPLVADDLFIQAALGGCVDNLQYIEHRFPHQNLPYHAALQGAAVKGKIHCLRYLLEKTDAAAAEDAFTQLAQWPARSGQSGGPIHPENLEYTLGQQLCLEALSTECNVFRVFDRLKSRHPTNPLHWIKAEEHLYGVQQRGLTQNAGKVPRVQPAYKF